MIQQVFPQIQMVLLHHHLFIQNAQIGFPKCHVLNSFQNESNIPIKHLIMFNQNLILNHPYHIILLSPQISMIILYLPHLSIARWTLVSAYILKLITLFLRHLFPLTTLTFSLQYHSWSLLYTPHSLLQFLLQIISKSFKIEPTI